MFVGHYAVSFVARRSSTDLPLWIWFVAVQWLDFVFMTLALLGVEKVRLTPGFTDANNLDLYYMPYSHSLVAATILSLIFGGIVAALFPAARTGRGFALVALASFSHWVLDALVHTPDLPLLNGETKVGLGLWNHLAVSLPLELAVLLLGGWFYARGMDRERVRRVWILLGIMVLTLSYSTFAPQATSVAQFAVSALAAYVLFILIPAWVDRPTGPSSGP